MLRCISTLAAVAGLVPVLVSGPLPAQLPAGHFAVGAGQTQPFSTQWTGPPGIFVGHPRTPGTLRAVTGLPPALTAPLPNTPNGGFYGVSSMLVHPPSGDLLVGTIPHGTTPNPVVLYRLRVDTATLAATVVATFPLGTTMGTEGDVNQIAWLGGDRVVVACNHVTGAVGAGSMAIAEVDLAANPATAVTPWPVAARFAAFAVQAICVDRHNGFAYVGGGNSLGAGSTIHRIALPGAGATAATAIATLPIFVDNLQFDAHSGTVLASGRSNSPATGAVFRIDPATGVVTTLLVNWQNAPAFALEEATGDLLFGGVQTPGATTPAIWHLPSGAALSTALTLPAALGTTGFPMAIAMAPSPSYSGAASALAPGMPPVAWQPRLGGGLPQVGNAAFALQLDVPAPQFVTGYAGLSLGLAPPGATIPGTPMNLYLEVNGGWLGGAALGGPTLPLPIPAHAALRGLVVHAQALTIATVGGIGTFAATDLATITVL